MFGNNHVSPCYTSMSPRRYSQWDVSIAPKISQRRATMPVIDLTGMSPGLGNMMGGYNRNPSTPCFDPSTPCFVTPTLGGFSGRRFSFDSPLQTISALSSGGLPTLNRKAAKRAWAKMSTRSWSRSFKITAIIFLTCLAFMLFYFRKVKEDVGSDHSTSLRHASCNEDTGTCEAWEAHFHDNKPKEEFMALVSQNDHYHSLESEPGDLWVNRWLDQEVAMIDTSQTSESLDEQNESEVYVVEEPAVSGAMDLNSASDEKLILESAYDAREDLSIKESPSDSQSLNPSHVLQGHTDSGPTDIPLKHNHMHVLNGVTSYHGNTHYHAMPEQEWEMQKLAPVNQAQMNPGHHQLIDGSQHQPAVPQPPTGHLPVPKSNEQKVIYGMQPQPSNIYPDYVPPVQGMQQHQHMYAQYHLDMRPQPGQSGVPGTNNYNRHQIHNQGHISHNPLNNGYHSGFGQGKIIGHNTPQHNGYQTRYNQGYTGYNSVQNNGYQNGQRHPPGVNPNRYMGL